MHGRTHELKFTGLAPFRDIESLLQVAVFSIEGLFGASQIRMSVAYERDAETRTITIGTATCAGDALAKAFISLCTRELGEAAFTVTEIIDGEDDDWSAPSEAGVA